MRVVNERFDMLLADDYRVTQWPPAAWRWAFSMHSSFGNSDIVSKPRHTCRATINRYVPVTVMSFHPH